MDSIRFTPAKLRAFRDTYREARAVGSETFWFEGKQVFVGYSKYLIEHLSAQFKKGKKHEKQTQG